MNIKETRVRFAPAPTGMMHLGNIRAALMNYLFASQKKGTFVLRIEDTDPQRNYDPDGSKIIEDLHWLGLSFDEGPGISGPHKPYFQSKRIKIYREKLAELEKRNLIYRCFCSQEELEQKRQRQRALKLPPRYDRTCLHRTKSDTQQLLEKNSLFVWRFKLNHKQNISISDLAHGNVTFEFKNFSDFPITRQDGSFTFMFANFVDDMTMGITHVFRGEDHLTNTAGQAALYSAFNTTLPTFLHMPILCNIDGKKLSKRDFGFSLRDLKKAGFLPDAIVNYLGIIGASFEQEIMTLDQLAHAIDFDKLQTTGHIKYDVEKLRWINHKWIALCEPTTLAQYCKPFLQEAYPAIKELHDGRLTQLLQIIKTDLTTLTDSIEALKFYFNPPALLQTDIQAVISTQHVTAITEIIGNQLVNITNADTFIANIKQDTKAVQTPIRELFWFIRLALTGKTNGPSIHDLLAMLGSEKTTVRLEKALQLLR